MSNVKAVNATTSTSGEIPQRQKKRHKVAQTMKQCSPQPLNTAQQRTLTYSNHTFTLRHTPAIAANIPNAPELTTSTKSWGLNTCTPPQNRKRRTCRPPVSLPQPPGGGGPRADGRELQNRPTHAGPPLPPSSRPLVVKSTAAM
ncbi:uncharacterized protein EKO05_0004889 [Ascochyta rabiei]|uniref:uncharacterized protein n=1 Tax=Didymella rabiei TaxID=5454 RepID=UPI0021FBBDFF|nr:uncharacterized protein EKO05_0004889 [Ascochyta rabiei]UPX14406.1 hypothetical protein EKO05_0004889 [Ascochyta rabiei]